MASGMGIVQYISKLNWYPEEMIYYATLLYIMRHSKAVYSIHVIINSDGSELLYIRERLLNIN